MTQAIRDAAQALLKSHDAWATVGELKARWDALREALSAPQPTADERVEHLMDLVESYGEACAAEQRAKYRVGHESHAVHTRHDLPTMLGAVEQSARALLSDPQDDAEHAALRFMRLLSADARADVMSNFCKQCGSDNPSCQCWNDE